MLTKVTMVTNVTQLWHYADVIFYKANTKDNELQRLQNRYLSLCLGDDEHFSNNRVHKEALVPFPGG